MAHKAFIKDFHVEQELKNNGVEVGVWEGDKQFGDIYVAKTGITWCDGKTHRKNGTRISFAELSIIAKHKNAALKAARDAGQDE